MGLLHQDRPKHISLAPGESTVEGGRRPSVQSKCSGALRLSQPLFRPARTLPSGPISSLCGKPSSTLFDHHPTQRSSVLCCRIHQPAKLRTACAPHLPRRRPDARFAIFAFLNRIRRPFDVILAAVPRRSPQNGTCITGRFYYSSLLFPESSPTTCPPKFIPQSHLPPSSAFRVPSPASQIPMSLVGYSESPAPGVHGPGHILFYISPLFISQGIVGDRPWSLAWPTPLS